MNPVPARDPGPSDGLSSRLHPTAVARAGVSNASATARPLLRLLSRPLLALTLFGALSACGGGGGGGPAEATGATGTAGGGGTSGGASSSSVSVTGLVPSAPAAGATLYADAAVLRPVQDGGVWRYRGTAIAGPGVDPIAYLTSTTQSTTAAGAVIETFTNSANDGAASSGLSTAAGLVASSQPVDFTGKGTPELLQLIELRSPVRQGDQVTILDRHIADSGVDLDGDGKNDALDVAAYSKVVGIEPVALPNLPTVQAVRVDTVVAYRATYSSTGKMSSVVQATQQTWYGAGIGIVRQSTSRPTASNNGVATTDELISSWDGGSAGFGAMDTVLATVPATSGIFPGQGLQAPIAPDPMAFAFGDHALVVTTPVDVLASAQVSKVDLRGKVTGTQLLANLPGRVMARALRNGLALIVAGGSEGVDYTIIQVDANGALSGSAAGAAVRLAGAHVQSQVTRLAVAADDSTLWFLWTRYFYDPGEGRVPGNELVLRAYSPAGEPLGPEQIIDSGNLLGLDISAAGGQALLTWVRAQPGSGVYPPYDVYYRSASLAALGSTQVFAQGLNTPPFVTPLRLGADGALVWKSAIGSNANLGASGGIRLDPTLQPLRAGSSFIDEQIAGLPPFDALSVAPLPGSSRLFAVSTQNGRLWPDSNDFMTQSLGWMDITGSTPLAKLPVQTLRFSAVNPVAVVGFADRALVFGNDSGRLTSTVVWLNDGSASR